MNFDEALSLLQNAHKERNPYLAFGDISNDLDLTHVFNRLALIVHPDTAGYDVGDAGAVFAILRELRGWAEDGLANGSYGAAAPLNIEVKTKLHQFVIKVKRTPNDVCNIFTAVIDPDPGINAVMKVAIQRGDNDLMTNEAKALEKLQASAGEYAYMFPSLVESFEYDAYGDKKRVRANVVRPFMPINNLYTLREVVERHAGGVDPRDMAWIWRRVLMALGTAHDLELINGLCTPDNIYIEPIEHVVMIFDWTNSSTGSPLKYISTAWEDWYPKKVFDKAPAQKNFDISMAAKSMSYIASPYLMPLSLKRYFERAMYSDYPFTAWGLLQDFDVLIGKEWGARTFRQFPEMPKKG